MQRLVPACSVWRSGHVTDVTYVTSRPCLQCLALRPGPNARHQAAALLAPPGYQNLPRRRRSTRRQHERPRDVCRQVAGRPLHTLHTRRYTRYTRGDLETFVGKSQVVRYIRYTRDVTYVTYEVTSRRLSASRRLSWRSSARAISAASTCAGSCARRSSRRNP